jgi:LmbE family N-acetylglucosaminyl deacetylase
MTDHERSMPVPLRGQLEKLDLIKPVKQFLRLIGFTPRRWLAAIFVYSRFMGYIWPKLLTSSKSEYLVRMKLAKLGWCPQVLSAPVGGKVLFISPHPDDEAIGAGGLLLAHKGMSEIHILCLTNGELGGGLETSPNNPVEFQRIMGQTRQAELKEVGNRVGAASIEFFNFADGSITCDLGSISKLRDYVMEISPDVIVLPWFLDAHADHRAANVLYAAACSDFDCLVLAYEIWALLEPNAIFNISDILEEKIDLVKCFRSQLRTVDYVGYAAGLARVRAYHTPVRGDRSGAVEAFIALPNREYCALVRSLSQQSE